MGEDFDRNHFVEVAWMPSRIPMLDALTATFPKGVEPPTDRFPKTSEQRWFPLPDGAVRVLLPYDGKGSYDKALFCVEPKAWDHTTCDVCVVRIPAMTLHYVTRADPYIELCAACYEQLVARRVGFLRYWIWRAKQAMGRPSDA